MSIVNNLGKDEPGCTPVHRSFKRADATRKRHFFLFSKHLFTTARIRSAMLGIWLRPGLHISLASAEQYPGQQIEFGSDAAGGAEKKKEEKRRKKKKKKAFFSYTYPRLDFFNSSLPGKFHHTQLGSGQAPHLRAYRHRGVRAAPRAPVHHGSFGTLPPQLGSREKIPSQHQRLFRPIVHSPIIPHSTLLFQTTNEGRQRRCPCRHRRLRGC